MAEVETPPNYDSRPETYEHILAVQRHLHVVVKLLLNRALRHDHSKVRAPERQIFDAHTPKLWGLTYGSDEYNRVKAMLTPALEHHYATNRHHPEHHRDGVSSMNILDLLEMLCDWMAATARHEDGDIRASIEINQDRFEYSDEFKRLLHNTVDALEQYL